MRGETRRFSVKGSTPAPFLITMNFVSIRNLWTVRTELPGFRKDILNRYRISKEMREFFLDSVSLGIGKGDAPYRLHTPSLSYTLSGGKKQRTAIAGRSWWIRGRSSWMSHSAHFMQRPGKSDRKNWNPSTTSYRQTLSISPIPWGGLRSIHFSRYASL